MLACLKQNDEGTFLDLYNTDTLQKSCSGSITVNLIFNELISASNQVHYEQFKKCLVHQKSKPSIKSVYEVTENNQTYMVIVFSNCVRVTFYIAPSRNELKNFE